MPDGSIVSEPMVREYSIAEQYERSELLSSRQPGSGGRVGSGEIVRG